MLVVLSWFTPDADAMPRWLTYRAADKGQHCYRVLGQEGDSVTVCDCVGTSPLVETQTVYLWGQPLSGGGFAARDSHRVAPGAQDSFPIPWAGNFYTVQRNSKGTSCPSPVTTVLPDVVTGIEPTPPARIQRWIDVHGRAHTERPRASGIYLWQYKLGETWSKARKHLILK